MTSNEINIDNDLNVSKEEFNDKNNTKYEDDKDSLEE